MNACKICKNYSGNGKGTCIGLATDGYYFWYSPVDENDPLANHVDVINSMKAAEANECNSFEEIK
jgi:hypothetical protein